LNVIQGLKVVSRVKNGEETSEVRLFILLIRNLHGPQQKFYNVVKPSGEKRDVEINT
jgi:hypothetical protein